MTDDKKPQETKVTQLAPNRMALAEHAHQTWVATPEKGTPPDALLDSKYWAHYSVNQNMDVRVHDIILVKPEDGTFFQELLVRDKAKGGLAVVELRRVILDKHDQSDESGDFELKFSGPVLKWRVIRLSDKRELVSGLPDKTSAQTWIREHLKAA